MDMIKLIIFVVAFVIIFLLILSIDPNRASWKFFIDMRTALSSKYTLLLLYLIMTTAVFYTACLISSALDLKESATWQMWIPTLIIVGGFFLMSSVIYFNSHSGNEIMPYEINLSILASGIGCLFFGNKLAVMGDEFLFSKNVAVSAFAMIIGIYIIPLPLPDLKYKGGFFSGYMRHWGKSILRNFVPMEELESSNFREKMRILYDFLKTIVSTLIALAVLWLLIFITDTYFGMLLSYALFGADAGSICGVFVLYCGRKNRGPIT